MFLYSPKLYTPFFTTESKQTIEKPIRQKKILKQSKTKKAPRSPTKPMPQTCSTSPVEQLLLSMDSALESVTQLHAT